MMAELTSSGVSQPADEERRIAIDGKAYTWPEFMEFYGESAAAPFWSSADIHRAAEERSGASDGHADVGGGYEAAEPHPSAAPSTESTAPAAVNTLLTSPPAKMSPPAVVEGAMAGAPVRKATRKAPPPGLGLPPGKAPPADVRGTVLPPVLMLPPSKAPLADVRGAHPPDPPEEIESPFSRHIVFDFRRMSGELVIRFDSEDPCWWRYKSVEDVLERMQHGIFHSSLPPLAKAPPPHLGLPVREEYQLIHAGTRLSGDWDNIDLPFGTTVYIIRLDRSNPDLDLVGETL